MIKFNDVVEYRGEGAPNEATEHLKGKKGLITKSPVTVGDETFASVCFEDGGTRFVNVENLKLVNDEKFVTINVEEFSAHHDECLAVADELFALVEKVAILQSLPLATALNDLANRLDKSISKLPAKF